VRTPDIGGNATTREFALAVLRRLGRTAEEDGVSAYGWGV
jgi:hypothetical protein